MHVLCCLAGHALNSDADPMLPGWQQVILLVVTLALLFATAEAHKLWVARRRARAAAVLVPAVQ